MHHWAEAPDDVAERLTEIATLFSTCREVFFETADRYHWAAHVALPSPDPGVASPVGETGTD